MSACSASRCELTETNSPTAIDNEPATKPATPATKIDSFDADDAATPIIKLAVETIASSAPSTAARSQPARPLRCTSPSDPPRFAFAFEPSVMCAANPKRDLQRKPTTHTTGVDPR